MKKLLLSLLLIGVRAAAQPVVTIPDVNFKNKLLNQFTPVDLNGDGQIQVAEAQAVTFLDVGGANISSLEGIQSFSNLQTLRCNNNQISTIDLSNCLLLTNLNCDMNNITNLDVHNHVNLGFLSVSDNPITSLNLEGCTALYSLEFNRVPVENLKLIDLPNLRYFLFSTSVLKGTLTISGCHALRYIGDVTSGPFDLTDVTITNCAAVTAIDLTDNARESVLHVRNCPNLENLSMQRFKMTDFEIVDCPKLEDVNFQSNLLTTADFSNLPMLGSLILNGNQLVSLNMKNGSNESSFAFETDTLLFVCADETQLNDPGFDALIDPNIDPTVLNSYCSFTPGGNYNTINGKVTFDENNNGCDENDAPHSFIKMKLSNATNQASTFTAVSGDYRFYANAGNFTVTPEFENPAYFTATPATATVIFPENDNSVTTQNFCFAANAVHPDLEIVIAPLVPARPGFNALYQIVYKNKGNQTLSGNISFNFDDALLDFISASIAPDAQAIGLLAFNYSNLRPFESRWINVSLKLNAPTETPPVNIDDSLIFSAAINPIATDEMPEDNTFQFTQTVVGSFDPNDKTCIEGATVSTDQIGKYLHYVINFENTGTHVAENVVVKDIINTAQFDINSLQILSATDGMSVKINGNVVEFIFEGIHLPIGGHGNVLFKIRTLGNLAADTTVSNTADIFFDYNAPIVTNPALTRFQNLSVSAVAVSHSIVYPNPATTSVNVKSAANIQMIELYDVQGRMLEMKKTNSKWVSIDISDKNAGIYFLKVTSDKGSNTEKIVIK